MTFESVEYCYPHLQIFYISVLKYRVSNFSRERFACTALLALYLFATNKSKFLNDSIFNVSNLPLGVGVCRP